jgi:dipeptidase E
VADLMLLSNSTAPGSGFLEYALKEIREVLGERDSLLFIPYASNDPDLYTGNMRRALAQIDVRVDGLHEAPDPVRAVRDAQAVFTGGGNTFRLLRTVTDRGLLGPLREAVQYGGVPYMGASAGSNLACPSIRTTNDMPIVECPSLAALGLIPFQINPHYLDPDHGSTHMGETRELRIEQFLEVNDVAVVGLREGSWLRVAGRSVTLAGLTGARLFRRGGPAQEIAVGADLSFLLDARPRFDAALAADS